MAGYAKPEMLIEPDEFQSRMADPNVRIMDCDVPDQYLRAHIPGAAVYRGHHYYKEGNDLRFVMEPGTFAETMASLGIGDDTEVLAYDASGSLYAARLWWCLNYYGHPKVRILNGGWDRWLKEGRPMTMETVSPPRASFTPKANESMRATAEYIMAEMKRPDIVLLDVRTDEEWAGTNNRGNKRAGHMPGAVHIEWVNNVEPAGERKIKSADDLRAMFEKAGVTPDKEIVTMCQGGIRAAQMAMTLTLLGYGRVRNYDGSFRDWGNRDDTPIVID